MEARASFGGAAVPKTFVAAVLVIVAMGLAAMGGYVARGLSGGAVEAQSQTHAAPGSVLRQDNPARAGAGLTTVHAAPGTVLRQDNPARAGAELPSYIQQAITPKVAPRILQDDPYFIAQYSGSTSEVASDDGLMTRKGGHKELP
jgi:hypothetical protein